MARCPSCKETDLLRFTKRLPHGTTVYACCKCDVPEEKVRIKREDGTYYPTIVNYHKGENHEGP